MAGQRGELHSVCLIGRSAKGLQFGGDSSESRRSWGPDQEIRLPIAALGWVGVGRRGRCLRDRYSMPPALRLLSYSQTKTCCTLYSEWNIILPLKEDTQHELKPVLASFITTTV